jgi:soluble lytic murein transglycosylase
VNRFLKSILWLIATVAATVALHHAYVVLVKYHAFDELIRQSAAAHGLDPELVSAVIWRESRFDPFEVGRNGEIGLMQVTRTAGMEWAKANGLHEFSSADLFSPATNVAAGAWYLARALDRWRQEQDPIPYALAEYNAGRSNALRWAAQPGCENPRVFADRITYPSTRRYVADILNRHRRRRWF